MLRALFAAGIILLAALFASAPASAQTAVFNSTLPNVFAPTNQNTRQVYPAALWIASPSGMNQVRLTITFAAGVDGTYSWGTFYFGLKGASSPNFDGSQVQILFGGSGTFSQAVSLGSTQTFVSDWATLPANFDATKAYVVAVFNGPVSGNSGSEYDTSATGEYWSDAITGSTTSSQTTPANMSGPGGDTVLFSKIEVRAAPGSGGDAPLTVLGVGG